MPKQKTTLVGFKATEEELNKISRLISRFEKESNIPGVTISNAQILRMALNEFYKNYILFENDISFDGD